MTSQVIASSENTTEFATTLIDKYCYGNPRYINKKNIRLDIVEALNSFITETTENETTFEDQDMLNDHIHDTCVAIQGILMIWKEEIADETMGKVERISDFDCKISDEIEEFFRIYYKLED